MELTGRAEAVTTKYSAVCGIVSASLGALGLVGWIGHLPILTHIRESYIPMAPTTALGFVVLGFSLVFTAMMPSNTGRGIWLTAALLGIMLLGAAEMYEFAARTSLGVDEALAGQALHKPGVFGHGHMSPLTAVNLWCLGAAMILLEGRRSRPKSRTASGLSLWVLCVNYVVAIGYAFGTPPLYGGGMIPVALTTALAFMSASAGVILRTGPDAFPMQSLVGGSVGATLLRVFLPISMAIVIIDSFLTQHLIQRTGSGLAVQSALLALVWAAAVGLIVARVAKRVGGSLDRAEAALRESEEQYRTLFEESGEAIFILDTEGDNAGRIVTANKAAARIHSYTVDELQSMNMKDLDVPADAARLPERLARTVSGEMLSGEVEHIRKDGSVFPLEFHAAPLDVHGRRYALLFEWDITERKVAEEALRRISRSREMVRHANQLLVRAEDETNLLDDTCRIVVEVGGYRMAWVGLAEEDEAKTVRPVAWAGVEEGYLEGLRVSWADTALARDPTGTTIRIREPVICRNILEDPDYVLWRADAFRHGFASLAAFPLVEGDRAFGALNIYASEWNAFDQEEMHLLSELADDLAYGVTSVRTQEELRRNEANYRAIFDTANDAIFVHDTETGAILDVNPKMTEMYGYTPEEAREINVEVLSSGEPPYTQEDVLRWIGKAVEGEPQLFEWRAKDKAGGVFWVEVNLKRASIAGKDRLLAIVRDITQRKKSEEECAQYAEDLARSNAELQEFAYVASHDLQEPLRMVGSYVQLLAKRYQGRLDPDADEFIGFAVEGVERMDRLISDLLQYSRVGPRGKPFEATDSEAVLAETLESLKAGIEESGAEVTHDPLPMVNADALQLEQVFRNLIANAMKFRREDEPPRIHVSAEKSDHEWVFSVRDNGMGMAPEHVGRLFKIFERLHPAGRYPGTGMGLAICKKIVERHRGRIWVESELGTGSTFYFTIPE